MKCQVHDCEMEWIPAEMGFQDGFWSCERCVEEEEAEMQGERIPYNDADYEFDGSLCVYCHSGMHDGYCWASPDGNHLHEGD